jgi:phosphoglycolate phosphatase
MRYKYILFDLDGTLTDSGPGIINSVIYALDRFNIKVENRDMLCSFIGPPLTDSFHRFMGSSREEAERAVAYYRNTIPIRVCLKTRSTKAYRSFYQP